MSVFRGRYYHTIDEKGRIMFPARLCQVFTEKYDERMVITNWDGCLLVFPYNEWIAIEEKVFQQSIIEKKCVHFSVFLCRALLTVLSTLSEEYLYRLLSENTRSLRKRSLLLAWGGV